MRSMSGMRWSIIVAVVDFFLLVLLVSTWKSWGCRRMSEKFIQSHVFYRKNVRPAMNSISFSLLFLLRVPKIILIFHPICFALELKAWAKGRVKGNLIVSGEWVDIPGMINYFQFIFLIFSSSSSALLSLFHHLECLPMRLQRCAWFESGRNFIIFQFSSVFYQFRLNRVWWQKHDGNILRFETFQLIAICKNLVNLPNFLDKSVRVRFQSAEVSEMKSRIVEIELYCWRNFKILDIGYHCRIESEKYKLIVNLSCLHSIKNKMISDLSKSDKPITINWWKASASNHWHQQKSYYSSFHHKLHNFMSGNWQFSLQPSRRFSFLSASTSISWSFTSDKLSHFTVLWTRWCTLKNRYCHLNVELGMFRFKRWFTRW